MAVQTFEELNQLIQTTTVAVTALADRFVRRAYATGGQPFNASATQNVVYYSITPVPDEYDKLIDYTYADNGTPNTSTESAFYTRVIECAWVIYGANSFDIADTLRFGMLQPSIRETMAEENVFVIPLIDPATLNREQINGQWYNRSDLRIKFNVGTLRDATLNNFSEMSIEIESGGPSVVLEIPLE